MADEIGDQRAAEPADGPGDDVGRQDGVACGCTEVLDADLIVAHRLHEIAERRGEEPGADIDHGSDEHEHEVILYKTRMRRRHARQRKTSHAEPIGSAGEIVELDQHRVEDHRQRKAQHREIDAAEAREQ